MPTTFYLLELKLTTKQMFDFEKLKVYQRIKTLNTKILKYLYATKTLDVYLKNQLKRACLSVAFNLAEGAGRQSPRDKKHFYVIARASCFECVAILEQIKEIGKLSVSNYGSFYQEYLEIVKMLQGLIKATK